jgi:hypothetical protein
MAKGDFPFDCHGLTLRSIVALARRDHLLDELAVAPVEILFDGERRGVKP